MRPGRCEEVTDVVPVNILNLSKGRRMKISVHAAVGNFKNNSMFQFILPRRDILIAEGALLL